MVVYLNGLAVTVSELCDAIRKIIFELKEVTTLSRRVIWKWASASNVYSSLPVRVFRAIEIEYEVKINQNHFSTSFL